MKSIFESKNKKDILEQLSNKEVVDSIRKDADLQKQLVEILTPEVAIHELVSRKVLSSFMVTEYVEQALAACLKNQFNPGTDLIIDAASVCVKPSEAELLSKVIKANPTNKYDAKFVKSLCVVATTDSSIGPVLADFLAESEFFVEFYQSLKSGRARLDLILSMPNEDKASTLADLSSSRYDNKNTINIENPTISDLLLAWKVACKFRKFGIIDRYEFKDLMKTPGIEKSMDAEIYIGLINHFQNEFGHHFQLQYNALLEKVPANVNEHGLSRLSNNLANVPRDSKYWLDCVQRGKQDISKEDFISLIGNRHRKYSRYFSPLQGMIKCLGDDEVAELIKANTVKFLSEIKNNHITPAVLANSIPRDYNATASAFFEIVGSSHRKMLSESFSSLKAAKVAGGKLSIAEIHHQVIASIQTADGPKFQKLISAYEGGLNGFCSRHSQATYRSKYEGGTLSRKFIASLNDETTILTLIEDAGFSLSHYYDDESGLFTPSMIVSLLRIQAISKRVAVQLSTDQIKIVDLLTPEQLVHAELTHVNSKAAALVAKKIVKVDISKVGKSSRYDDDGLEGKKFALPTDSWKHVAPLMTKKEFLSKFSIRVYENEATDLEFRGGEKIDTSDILNEATRSSYGVEYIIDALVKIKSPELLAILQAVASKDAKAYKKYFPQAGNRSDRTKAKASQLLLEMDPDALDVGNLLKKNNHISSLSTHLKDKAFEVLLGYESKNRRTIAIDTFKVGSKKIKVSDLHTLAEKYDLDFSTFEGKSVLPESLEMVRFFESLIAEGFISSVNYKISNDRWSSKKITPAVVEYISENIPLERLTISDDSYFEAAKMGLAPIVFKDKSISEIISYIKREEDFKIYHSLGLPMDNVALVEKLNVLSFNGLNWLVSLGVKFNGEEIVISDYMFEKQDEDDARELACYKKLGLVAVSEYSNQTRFVEDTVFDAAGNIKEFEPVSLSFMELEDKIDLIKNLSKKNPKYKALLAFGIERGNFVLPPPSMLSKATMTVESLKENLGFGAPNGLSKEQKSELETLLTMKGFAAIKAVNQLKAYLSAAGLSEMKYEDIFEASGEVRFTELAEYFINTNNAIPSDLEQFLNSVMKKPSKGEMISLLRSNGQFAAHAIADAVRDLNNIAKSCQEYVDSAKVKDLTADLMLAAISGDQDSAQTIEGIIRSSSEEVSASLIALSNAIKPVVVNISIMRKRAKGGEDLELGKLIHDELGQLVMSVRSITKAVDNAKTLKLRSGLERLNEEMLVGKNQVKDKKGKVYSIYFPNGVLETREIGKAGNWCTLYNDSYFKDTCAGTHILFNLKRDGEVTHQGYINTGSWKMTQFSEPGNQDASEAFNVQHIIDVIRSSVPAKRNKQGQEAA